MLFNVYSKIIFTETLDGKPERIKMINTIRKIDDTTILTSVDDL